MSVKQLRKSNFELMRIISMFFIVIFHMIIDTGGNLINYTSGTTKLFLEFILMIIVVHVNSFILISGYFQYDKKISFKKVISLIGMAWFYKVLISFIFYFFGAHTFTFLEIIKILSPIEFSNNWFLIVYISLYLLSPYINILIEKLSQREHRKLIIILFIMFSIISTITNQNTFTNTGFSLKHFIYLYIVGAYLKKYPVSLNIHFTNFSNKKKRFIFLSLFLFLGFVNYLLYEYCNNLLLVTNSEFLKYICNCIRENMFYYQNPLLIIQSVCYLLFFETLSFKNKFINKVASLTFAVYIIHENPFISSNMYRFFGIYKGKMIYGHKIIIWMFVCSIITMITCLLIEFIRRIIFGFINKLIDMTKKRKCKV